MARKLVFGTLSLGTEPPAPGAGDLAVWVGAQRGRRSDLISYLLEEGLIPQRDAGVTSPCTGGMFYGDRMKESLLGLEGDEITGELGIVADYVTDDTIRIRQVAGPCMVAVPAPHRLTLADRYYGDEDEAMSALSSQYRHLFRVMRDRGVAGHVIHCSDAVPGELEALSSGRVFFYLDPVAQDALAEILEHQRSLAVRGGDLPLLCTLAEDYDIDRVILVDPVEKDIRDALDVFDPDRIWIGGYCITGDRGYWKSLTGNATLSVQ